MIEGAQYIDGKVAIRYYQPIPKLFKVNGKDYSTDVRYGVSLILADEEDVPALLEFIGGCCNQKRKVFSLATELAVKVWREGHY